MNPPIEQPSGSSHNCYYIPANCSFVNVLARSILSAYEGDSEGLARVLVLLPSRRACRSLRDAFLECTGGKPMLLPRIQPVGDVGDALPFGSGFALLKDLPVAISDMRRELLLTKLVVDFQHRQSGADAGTGINFEPAAEMARQLAHFMDDAAREGLGMERLQGLVVGDLAQHWQQIVDFLSIISHRWPLKLQEEGVIDPVDHRNRVLAATAKDWAANPPPWPVIAAGSTGSMPATAQLLATIAHLPQGKVILPGLDTQMPEREWSMIGETHPQFVLKQLLDTMECKRADVRPVVQDTPHDDGLKPRFLCLAAVLQPPEMTSGWSQSALPLADGLQGVRLITADTLLDEARMIAIALREVLETPGKTAALVTPDRTLARMVAAQMGRFGISIDDSAGYPLKDTPVGCFLRLAVDMAAGAAAPVDILALLRHPLAAAGMDTAECRRLSRVLEMEFLRGIRRRSGLEPLLAATKSHDKVHSLLLQIAKHIEPLTLCFSQRLVSLRAMIEAHVSFAEWLASTADEAGTQRLWMGEASNQMAAFLAELIENADILAEIDPTSYPGLLEAFLSGQNFRPRYGLHPRLRILSPIEARLQRFDRVVLGSLNEGTWPSSPAVDPWMSRPMRTAFGLPAAERVVGQSAHDVYMQCGAQEVILTRAQKVEGKPTVPSRWLVRLETLVSGTDPKLFDAMCVEKYYRQVQQLIDAPVALPPSVRPHPKPPLEARPRQLRITAIDTWLSDPYRVYAQYILGLKALPLLDEEPNAADFGKLVHKALETFTRAWPESLPANLLEELHLAGRKAFTPMMDRPSVACLWWPRFESMASWLATREKERRNPGVRVFAECKGLWTFDVDGTPFTLTTSIDRIEVSPTRGLVIVDYKTGTVPKKAAVESGDANQLPLEALVAMSGELTPTLEKPCIVEGLEYWKLTGNPDSCDITVVGIKALLDMQVRLEELIRRYDNPETPYAASHEMGANEQYNRYAHLTRRQEWQVV